MKSNAATDPLLQLRNIGKAMRADFELLEIRTVQQLARCDADEMYVHIQTLTQSRRDPCVWDTYAAAIHQAKTGEALAWWEFTKVRKARQASGMFMVKQEIQKALTLPPPGTGRGARSKRQR